MRAAAIRAVFQRKAGQIPTDAGSRLSLSPHLQFSEEMALGGLLPLFPGTPRHREATATLTDCGASLAKVPPSLLPAWLRPALKAGEPGQVWLSALRAVGKHCPASAIHFDAAGRLVDFHEATAAALTVIAATVAEPDEESLPKRERGFWRGALERLRGCAIDNGGLDELLKISESPAALADALVRVQLITRAESGAKSVRKNIERARDALGWIEELGRRRAEAYTRRTPDTGSPTLNQQTRSGSREDLAKTGAIDAKNRNGRAFDYQKHLAGKRGGDDDVE